jgi:hypothetical protein
VAGAIAEQVTVKQVNPGMSAPSLTRSRDVAMQSTSKTAPFQFA